MTPTTNGYAAMLRGLYDECPKAVFAAIAVSFVTAGGDYPEYALAGVAKEWNILHQQGIVEQPLPGKLAHLLATDTEY